MRDRPNIIYFICHDLGKHLGCYDAMVASPNLDRFGASAVTFDNAFCSAPACSPSRACAITGLYSHLNGEVGLSHMGWAIRPDVKTVVHYLNEAGYETAHCGIAHEAHPRTLPFQVDMEHEWDDWDSANAVDRAIGYLEGRADDAPPFYLNIGVQEVHASRWSRRDEIVYDLYGGPVPEDEVYVPNYSIDCPEMRRRFGRFQASIAYMDRHFQRLLEAVDNLGLAGNTVVIFTTDHGIANHRAKGTLYDRGTEISLMVRMPGGTAAGRRVDDLVPNIDLAATVLDAAGVTPPEGMNGRSFLPLITGGAYRPWDAIFTERNFHGEHAFPGETSNDRGFVDRYDPVRAVRTRDFHYIRNFEPEVRPRAWIPPELPPDWQPCEGDNDMWPPETEPRPEEELYHVPHDPAEFCNVAEHPEYEAVRADLEQRLLAWMRETGDHVLRGEVPRRPHEPGWGPHWDA